MKECDGQHTPIKDGSKYVCSKCGKTAPDCFAPKRKVIKRKKRDYSK